MKNGPYTLVVAPSNYPGKKYRGRYCYEHHLVWWQNVGSLPKNGEVIHHKNKDKTDNRFSNLEILAMVEHSRQHAAENPKNLLKMWCAMCGKLFEREVREINAKIRKGQKDFYCNRSCMGKHFGAHRPKNILG